MARRPLAKRIRRKPRGPCPVCWHGTNRGHNGQTCQGAARDSAEPVLLATGESVCGCRYDGRDIHCATCAKRLTRETSIRRTTLFASRDSKRVVARVTHSGDYCGDCADMHAQSLREKGVVNE